MTGGYFDSVRLAMTRNVAFTAPDSPDDGLRGRTYMIPFEVVWQASLSLVSGGLSGWSLVGADDGEGIIRGRVRSRLRRFESAVTFRVSLDQDAQTRVDGMSASHLGRADFGVNARRLRRFFSALDGAMEIASGRRISKVRIAPRPAPPAKQAAAHDGGDD